MDYDKCSINQDLPHKPSFLRDIMRSETRDFFDFVKAAGIIGIYCFHFFGRIIGDSLLKNAVESGLLNNLLINVKTFSQFVFFILQTFSAFGNIGVELFILASGFGLYFSHLLRRGRWLSFYKKRFIRIMPLYYIFLFVYFLLAVFASNQEFYTSSKGLKILVYHLLLVQTFNESYVYYGFFYFIAILFQLYLFFPILTKVAKNDTIRFPFFVLSFFVPFILKKLFALSGVPFSGILFTDYLPFFFLGILIADSIYYERRVHKVLFDNRFSLLCVLLVEIVIYLIIDNSYFNRGVRTAIGMLVFLSLPCVFSIIRRLKINALLSLIAYSSYSFYLIHMIFINRVLIFYAKLGLTGSYLNSIYIGTLTLPFAMFTAYLIQKAYDRISKPFLDP